MKFDKEILIAAVVCLVLLVAVPPVVKLFSDKPATEAAQTTVVSDKTDTVDKAAAEKAAADKAVAEKAVAEKAAADKSVAGKTAEKAAVNAPAVTPEPNVILENGDIKVEINPVKNAVVKVSYLKHIRNGSKDPVINEYSSAGGMFRISPGEYDTWSEGMLLKPVVDKEKRSCSITHVWKQHRNSQYGELHITQTFTLAPRGYQIDCGYTLSIPGAKQSLNLYPLTVYGGEIRPWHLLSGDKKRQINLRVDWRSLLDDSDDVDGTDDDDDFRITRAPDVHWAAVSNKYFSTILKRTDSKDGFLIWNDRTALDGKNEYVISTGAVVKNVVVAPGQPAKLSFSVYDGPKKSDDLSDFVPGGAGVMHMAWGPINYLARFLLWVLGLFYSICGSWGVSIILLTVLVRSVFYPLTTRGNESMKKMQKIQPKFKELKEKYKDNPQLLNQKMAELYRQEGVNPLAGCLPILLQIPIFFALYAMLDNAIDLRNVSFLWCKNLAAPDTIFSIPLGFDMPLIGSSIPFNPLVLIMTALMVIQQRLTPMSADPAQKKMMAMMPIIMLLFLYDLPSGLTLYWTVSNLFSILQLQLQKKRGEKSGAAAENQGTK